MKFKKKQPRLKICFCGIDGTGKTTLAHRLGEELAAKGIKSQYVAGRFESFTLLRPLRSAAKMIFLGRKKTDHSEEGVKNKGPLFKRSWIAGIWRMGLLTDYFFQITYKVRIPLILGKSICVDRYVYDTAVDLAADLSLSVPELKNLLKSLLRLAPRPDIVFLADLPPEVAMERNLKKGDNLPVEYFYERRSYFLCFKDRPEMELLDALQNPDELFQNVLTRLKDKKFLV